MFLHSSHPCALLTDEGYDGYKLRAEIAKLVIYSKSNFIVIHCLNKRTYERAEMSSSAASAGSRTSGAQLSDTISSLEISWPLFIPPLSSHLARTLVAPPEREER
jgi:hypothetical protein